MADLTPHLSSKAGFENIVQAMNSYLKAQRFKELDSYLRGYMATDQSPISRMCLKMQPDCAHFGTEAWARVAREIVASSKGEDKVCAIGFDLTGHWEGEGPGFEVSVYGNKMIEAFHFSNQSHESLLAHAKYPTPWQGHFIDVDGFGPIKGLKALYAALYAYPHGGWYAHESSYRTDTTPPEGYVGYFLGLVFLHLRVQETFARELKQYGLPREMPVVLGTHAFMGIFFPGYNVLMNTTLARNVVSYEQIQIDQKHRNREYAKSQAAEQIEHMVKNWVTIRNVNQRARKDKAKSITDFLCGNIKFKLGGSNITLGKPVKDMDEGEFKRLMESYYQARLKRVS